MKKITLLFITLLSASCFAQQKSTGTVTFFTGLSANLLLDNSLSLATLTITGPSDRWFAVTIGSFSDPGAMASGNDIVYYNGTTLVDARHNGQNTTPSVDAINNWTVTSNTVSAGVRTLTATRPFVAEATDHTFVYSNTNISLAGAHASTAISNTLQYHGGGNRANLGSVPLTTLGVEDFSLRATQIYPNPSNGEFSIKTKTNLQKINVYTQTGSFVKTINVEDSSDAVEVNVKGFQTGIYLIELVNDNEKSWKKVIIK